MRWEETPIKYGIYMNSKTGQLAYAYPANDKMYTWNIDKGKKKPHPIFRATWHIVAEGTGRYFFHRELSGYELIERTHSWHQYTKRIPYKTNVKLFSFSSFYYSKRLRDMARLKIPLKGIEESCLVSKTK